MIETVAGVLNTVLALLRPLVFAGGFIAGVGAIVSWGVRARRISPFSPVARFVREKIDPVLVAPMGHHSPHPGGRWRP